MGDLDMLLSRMIRDWFKFFVKDMLLYLRLRSLHEEKNEEIRTRFKAWKGQKTIIVLHPHSHWTRPLLRDIGTGSLPDTLETPVFMFDSVGRVPDDGKRRVGVWDTTWYFPKYTYTYLWVRDGRLRRVFVTGNRSGFGIPVCVGITSGGSLPFGPFSRAPGPSPNSADIFRRVLTKIFPSYPGLTCAGGTGIPKKRTSLQATTGNFEFHVQSPEPLDPDSFRDLCRDPKTQDVWCIPHSTF